MNGNMRRLACAMLAAVVSGCGFPIVQPAAADSDTVKGIAVGAGGAILFSVQKSLFTGQPMTQRDTATKSAIGGVAVGAAGAGGIAAGEVAGPGSWPAYLGGMSLEGESGPIAHSRGLAASIRHLPRAESGPSGR